MKTDDNNDRVQFNARIGKEHKRNIKTDAAKLDLKNDFITEAIIAKFFRDYPPEMREEFYRAHKGSR